MCDEADLANFEEQGLSRRQFGVVGAMAMLSACATISGPDQAGLAETTATIRTPDGEMDAFFVHPATGSYPAVIFWPDGLGLRDAIKMMARRLASSGYAVLVPNTFYRASPAPQFTDYAAFQSEGGMEKIGLWRQQLTAAAVMTDARLMVSWLDGQQAVTRDRGIGTQGYCMGGGLAVWTAAALPARVKAVASFHGGGLVGDEPTSPSLMLKNTQAEFLFAIAKNDDARFPHEKARLEEAAQAAGVHAEIEVYEGDHGWTVLDFPIYAEREAERAWERLLALYARTL
jgi:carboxymethylenebutenolidase